MDSRYHRVHMKALYLKIPVLEVKIELVVWSMALFLALMEDWGIDVT